MSEVAAAAGSRVPNRLGALWRAYAGSPLAVAAAAVLLLTVLAGAAASAIAPQDPYDLAGLSLFDGRLPPLSRGADGNLYLLGTDDQSRDMLSAILYGLRTSLTVGLVATAAAAGVGVPLGLLAAWKGGRVDSLVMRLVDLQLSLPAILVALALLAALGRGEDKIILALALVQWAVFARTARASAAVERQRDYVAAAQCLGLPARRVLFGHVLPNALPPITVIAAVEVAHAHRAGSDAVLPRRRTAGGPAFARPLDRQRVPIPAERAVLDQHVPRRGPAGAGVRPQPCRRPAARGPGPSGRPRVNVLEVEALEVQFPSPSGPLRAVDGVSFALAPGQVLGLVGESGSGKTMTGYALLRLVPPPGRIAGGRVRLGGRDLLALSEAEMRRVRGDRIAVIMQDPMSCLNDVLRIGTQMAEAVTSHRRMGRTALRALARDALGRVGIPSPEERLDAYPHELSGGMRQRVAIATALMNRPAVIVADEPTTALDVTIQAQILSEVQRACAEDGTALLWITHDLSVVAGLADRIAVMYAGRIVEHGPADAVIGAPLHPYTEGLMASVPARNRPGERLRQIPGGMPGLAGLPTGCAFRPRCPRAGNACAARPALAELRPGHAARCVHPLLPC